MEYYRKPSISYLIIFTLFCFLTGITLANKFKASNSTKNTTIKSIDNRLNENVYYANLSPIPVLANNDPKNFPMPVGNEFYSFLGKSMKDERIQDLINYSFQSQYEHFEDLGNVIWQEEGFALKFDNNNILYQIQFFNSSGSVNSGIKTFKGTLPANLSWNMNRGDVNTILGESISTVSSPTSNLYSIYEIENGKYLAIITFNTKQENDMSASISDLLVMSYSPSVINTIDLTTDEKASNTMSDGSNTTTVHANNGSIQPIISPKNIPEKGFMVNSTPNNQQAYNSAYLAITGNDWYTMINRKQTDPKVTALIQDLGADVEVMQFADSYQIISKLKGIILVFSSKATLIGISLISQKNYLDMQFQEYQGSLPENLTFYTSRKEVEDRLGKPVDISYLRNSEYSCTYLTQNGKYQLIISYNTSIKDNTLQRISNIHIAENQ